METKPCERCNQTKEVFDDDVCSKCADKIFEIYNMTYLDRVGEKFKRGYSAVMVITDNDVLEDLWAGVCAVLGVLLWLMCTIVVFVVGPFICFIVPLGGVSKTRRSIRHLYPTMCKKWEGEDGN